MRKLVHIKWLVVAIFFVTLGACGTDELTQRTVQPASVEEERVDTIRLQLDSQRSISVQKSQQWKKVRRRRTSKRVPLSRCKTEASPKSIFWRMAPKT